MIELSRVVKGMNKRGTRAEPRGTLQVRDNDFFGASNVLTENVHEERTN